jgi:hypothetical protein
MTTRLFSLASISGSQIIDEEGAGLKISPVLIYIPLKPVLRCLKIGKCCTT